MAKTFDPNRVLPGTIELVRDANGNYTTKVVGLETINSLSLPEISTTAAVTKTDTDTKTATEITGDTVQKQTQMAFKTGDDNQPDTTGSMLQDEATKLSRNLSDFNPDTASEQFARQAFIPRQSTFDAEAEDSTENRTSIKDPTENVFGKSTLENEQRERQTTLPDLSVDVKKKEPPGLFGFKFDRPIRKEDFLGDKFKTTETRNTNPNFDQMAADAMDRQGGMPTDIERRQLNQLGSLGIGTPTDVERRQQRQLGMTDEERRQQFQLGSLGISAEPSKISALPDQNLIDKAKDLISNNLSFKAVTKGAEIAGTVLKGAATAIFGPETNSQTHAKGYFNVAGTSTQPQRIAGNPAENVFAGANANAKDLNRVAQKRIDTIEKNLAAGKYRDPDKKRQQLKDFKEQQANYKKDQRQEAIKRKGLDTKNPNEMRQADGGADSSPGGKSIVCTAMYQTTGLQDWAKAMKIWYIYQKRYLTIQHQEGYHKLFKPFVKAMHKNNIIKAIGAHFAKHRTQHLKHVMFNSKPSLLGKIYNKILEPICYWAGRK